MIRVVNTPPPATRKSHRHSIRLGAPWPDRRRVLVADDNAATRHWVAGSLRSVGFEVMECDDGAALLERLGSALMDPHQLIDAVIADVGMPGFSGLQVLEGLERAHSTTPVVLMTAFAAELPLIRARKHPGVAILVKPFDIDDLLTAIVRATFDQVERYDHAIVARAA
jgi:CheY-like chemotaxis protein